MLFPQYGVGIGVIGFNVEALYFLENLVSAVLFFVFDVQYWINEVLMAEQAEAILPAEAGEERAVPKGRLSLQIKFRAPPRRRAVLELGPEGVKIVAATLSAKRRKILDLQASRLFEIMIV